MSNHFNPGPSKLCIIDGQTSRIYQPLNSNRKEIRLAKVVGTAWQLPKHVSPQEDRNDVRISVTLDTFHLEHQPPAFEALSYTWGSATRTHVILVNGVPYSVRSNLYEFLCVFVSKVRDVQYIWIDQLSIDQDNDHERGHQVSLMKDIFSNASQVVIWLGRGDDHTAATLQCFERLNENWASGDIESFDFEDDENWLPAVQAFLRKPYWSRLWVVQEMILAWQLVVYWGPYEVNWLTIRALVTELVYSKTGKEWGIDGILERLNDIAITGRTYEDFTSLSLRGAVLSFCTSDCQDPRDKFYGLLGMVEQGAVIEADYRLSVKDVFLQAVRALTTDHDRREMQPHDVLYVCGMLRTAMLPDEPVEHWVNGKKEFVDQAILVYTKEWEQAVAQGREIDWATEHFRHWPKTSPLAMQLRATQMNTRHNQQDGIESS